LPVIFADFYTTKITNMVEIDNFLQRYFIE